MAEKTYKVLDLKTIYTKNLISDVTVLSELPVATNYDFYGTNGQDQYSRDVNPRSWFQTSSTMIFNHLHHRKINHQCYMTLSKRQAEAFGLSWNDETKH